MRCSTLLALLTLAGAARAAAQDPRLDRLDPDTRAAVTAIVDSARAARLPTEPLVDRALEGATKHAPGDLIVSAVRRLAGQLGRAQELLGSSASAAELETGVAALRAGADPGVLARLKRGRPRRPLTVPLAVLADLVATGVPSDTAAAVVLALARATDDDLVEFRRRVEHDIALGALPGTAASRSYSEYVTSIAGDAPNTNATPPSAPRKP
jgi:hypothetical protein